MSEFLRPQVATRVRDLSVVARSTAAISGAVVGASPRGPINKRTLVTNTREFIQLFGEPDVSFGYMQHSALVALQTMNKLYVTRVTNGAAYAGIVVNQSGAASLTSPLASGANPTTDTEVEDGTVAPIVTATENIGTGDNSTVTFAATLANIPVDDITDIQVGGVSLTNLVVDVSGGTITADELSAGTINGTTGAISITFNTAPAGSEAVTVTYNGESADALFMIFAENPGAWGNSLKFTVTNINATDFTFDITVIEEVDGVDIVREVLTVSRKNQKDGFGLQQYLEDKVNGNSIYIRVVDIATVADTVLPDEISTETSLSGGSDGSAVSESNVSTGWDLYQNRNEVDVRMLINAGYVTSTTFAVQSKMKSIAESRRDCIAFLDIPFDELSMFPTTDASNWRLTTQNFDSRFCALYGPWVEVFDTFNDKHNLPIPMSGFAALVAARRWNIEEFWSAPAGRNFGQIDSGVLPLEDLSHHYTDGQQDILYASQINFALSEPGQGTFLNGQKTMQSKASATDRINVHMLIAVTEKTARTFLQEYLFELNTAQTRAQVEEGLRRYFETVKAAQGVYDFDVVVDESNNPPAVIDNNQLVVDVYLQPTKTAEYIVYTSVITRTGVDFQTLINSQPA